MNNPNRKIVKDGIYKITAVQPFVDDQNIRTSKNGNKYNYGSLAVFVKAGSLEGIYWANSIVIMFAHNNGKIDFKKSTWFPRQDTEANYICDALLITPKFREVLNMISITDPHFIDIHNHRIIGIYKAKEVIR